MDRSTIPPTDSHYCMKKDTLDSRGQFLVEFYSFGIHYRYYAVTDFHWTFLAFLGFLVHCQIPRVTNIDVSPTIRCWCVLDRPVVGDRKKKRGRDLSFKKETPGSPFALILFFPLLCHYAVCILCCRWIIQEQVDCHSALCQNTCSS